MVRLRKAEEKDCWLIYKWRNDPRVRNHFFDSRALSPSGHERWYSESLSRKDRIMLLALDGEDAVGLIRFDLGVPDAGQAEIDIYVAPERQGKGIGSQILVLGEKWMKGQTDVHRIIGKVREDNAASMKMFRKGGFELSYVVFEKTLRTL